MSDQPPNQTSDTGDVLPLQGGWTQPQQPGTWRTPEKTEPPQGWRVPVLPKDVKEEAESPGEWHLPSPDDTSFTAEDEIEITEEVRPEDAVMEIAEIVPDKALVLAEQPPEEPVAPEDLMFMIEHIEEEDEQDSVQMSELIALASLVDKEQEPSGDDLLFGEDADVEEEDFFSDEQLSPSERLILGRTGPTTATTPMETEFFDVSDEQGQAEDNPADYARRQLEQLAGGAPATSATPSAITPSLGETPGESDPAAYARRQLAELGLSGSPDAVAAPPPPPQAEPVDPRQVELGRQFREVEQKLGSMRQFMRTGQMSQDEFINQLRNNMIHDDEGIWWMMGVDDERWYRSENNAWIEARPPQLDALEEAERRQPASGAYSAVVDDSLPYLDDSRTGPTREESAPGGIRLGADFMPLPDQVPLDDPDATVAGPAAFDSRLSYGAETVPGSSYYEPTQVSASVDYGNTIQSPAARAYDADYDQAPDYSLEDEGEIYQAAKERQTRSVQSMIILAAVAGIGFLFIAGALFVFLAINWYQGIVDEWQPQITALTSQQSAPLQTVVIRDINGGVIARIAPQGDDRRPVDSLGEISPFVIHAFLTLEDRTFYENPGWSFTSTLRAFSQNLFSGDIQSGGSTITQQIARSLVLGSNAPTADRKVNEIIVAGELTQQFTKDQLLLMYLNNVVFFGNQTYGIEAAAQFYFGKSAADLNLPEAAMLASIPSNPANNEPVNNRETANQLMFQTLDRMVNAGCLQVSVDTGQLCITQDMVDPIDLANTQVRQFMARTDSGLGDYPHFTQLVLNQLSAEYGDDIFRAGFQVTTTMDTRIQDAAVRALRDRVRELSQNGVNTGAVMVTDPRTGAVLAMVGSPNFNDAEVNGQFNFALGYNQPGSTIKPITYSASLVGVDLNANNQLDIGEYYTPASVLWDVPTTYDLGGGQLYTPRNIDNRFRGNIPLRNALQQSLNVPAVQAYDFIGPDAFRTLAERMGIRFLDGTQFGLAAALGATEVRLVDMMRVYGTLANDGRVASLYTIQSIVDANGNSIPIPPRPEPEQVISTPIAYLMQSILSDDVSRAPVFGRGSALTLAEFADQQRVAAKSGTTDGQRDLWTMGFTRNYVVGVWLGTFDDAQTFGNLTGSTAAAPVWNSVLRAALGVTGTAPPPFQPPQNGTVVQAQVCPLTGSVNTQCSVQLRNEVFAAGHPPPDAAQGQGLVQQVVVDSWTGLLANEFCSQNRVSLNFTTINNTAAIEWINGTAAGQDYARAVGFELPIQRIPTQACDLNTPVPAVNITTPVGNEVVQGTAYTIRGQVNASNFARYELQYATAGTENYQPLPGLNAFTQLQPNPNSTLATWNTTLLPNGNYTLRLAVFSGTGGFLYRTLPVTVNNPEPTATPQPEPTLAPIMTPIPFDTVPAQPFQNDPTPTIDPANPLG